MDLKTASKGFQNTFQFRYKPGVATSCPFRSVTRRSLLISPLQCHLFPLACKMCTLDSLFLIGERSILMMTILMVFTENAGSVSCCLLALTLPGHKGNLFRVQFLVGHCVHWLRREAERIRKVQMPVLTQWVVKIRILMRKNHMWSERGHKVVKWS